MVYSIYMESLKDILSQLKKQRPPKKGDESQKDLFDLNFIQTNPKRVFGDKGKYV